MGRLYKNRAQRYAAASASGYREDAAASCALYKIREFAALAGVTVKALHHYDRLGLLRPSRTDAGYRVYCERDLETLEQIVALKFLGIPLKEIGIVLKRPALKLPATLRLQRQALEEHRELLSRAIRVIQAAEESIASGKLADLDPLRKIIEVIDYAKWRFRDEEVLQPGIVGAAPPLLRGGSVAGVEGPLSRREGAAGARS